MHGLSGHSVKRQNPILRAVSLVSKNLWRKYALFGHSVYCGNIYKNVSHLREKYGNSPPKFLSIFSSWQLKFSLNILIWSVYLSIMETTRWYLSYNMYFVLLHCGVGMLMTLCFGRAPPILRRKRITPPQPLGYCSGVGLNFDLIEFRPVGS